MPPNRSDEECLLGGAESVYEETVRQNFSLIVNSVHPRDVVDSLYVDGVISADDVQDYGCGWAGVTARQRKEMMRYLY